MAGAWIVVHRPQVARRFLDARGGTAVLFGAALVLFVAGAHIATAPVGGALLATGMMVGALPVVSEPTPLAVGRPGRLLAACGAVSYTLLILHDALRIPVEVLLQAGAPLAVPVIYVFALQLPITFLLARPLARALGLLEQPVLNVPPSPYTAAPAFDTPIVPGRPALRRAPG
jgi:peptidoglycan/LPS O-acetylase OafA/YrhL